MARKKDKGEDTQFDPHDDIEQDMGADAGETPPPPDPVPEPAVEAALTVVIANPKVAARKDLGPKEGWIQIKCMISGRSRIGTTVYDLVTGRTLQVPKHVADILITAGKAQKA